MPSLCSKLKWVPTNGYRALWAPTAVSRRSLDQQKVALFSADVVAAHGLEIRATPGVTGDEGLNDLHRDIQPVDGATAEGLAAAYVAAQLAVFAPGQVAAAVQNSVRRAWLTEEAVGARLWEKVQAKLAEMEAREAQGRQ